MIKQKTMKMEDKKTSLKKKSEKVKKRMTE